MPDSTMTYLVPDDCYATATAPARKPGLADPHQLRGVQIDVFKAHEQDEHGQDYDGEVMVQFVLANGKSIRLRLDPAVAARVGEHLAGASRVAIADLAGDARVRALTNF